MLRVSPIISTLGKLKQESLGLRSAGGQSETPEEKKIGGGGVNGWGQKVRKKDKNKMRNKKMPIILKSVVSHFEVTGLLSNPVCS